MKQYIIILCLLLTNWAFSQTGTPHVISSASIQSNSGNINFHFTLGEVAVGQFNTGNIHYTAGYRQPDTKTVITQSIPLMAGWNWISLNVHPQNDSIHKVFEAVMPFVEQIKNFNKSYIPSNPSFFNTLRKMEVEEGYFVKVSQATVLEVTGCAVNPPDFPINLTTGWNFISFLPQTPIPVEDVVNQLGTSLIQIKHIATAYTLGAPSWANDLTVLQSGHGYLIKVSQNSSIIYN